MGGRTATPSTLNSHVFRALIPNRAPALAFAEPRSAYAPTRLRSTHKTTSRHTEICGLLPTHTSRALALPTLTPRIRRRLEADRFQRAAQTTKIDFIVFLAGPFIEPDDESQSKFSNAAELRFRLFHLLQDLDCEVTLGEYKELIDSYQGELGPLNNSAIAEMTHAQDLASMVVMIPASPGSFAELGAFSMKPDICSKMIILSDVKHQDSVGYVNTGPVILAKSLGAEIAYVDFDDVESCFAVVKSFSSLVRNRILLNMRLRG
jgi:hypothetical protein